MDKWDNYCDEIGGVCKDMEAQDVRIAELKQQLSEKITGETSDGYHTFNELYHHRAVLFSVICRCFPERSWKSRRHQGGTMYPGMFIVGIGTDNGQATYHYDIEPYWNMFPVRELEQAPEWDGHTPQKAIERIGKMQIRPFAELEQENHELLAKCEKYECEIGLLKHRIAALESKSNMYSDLAIATASDARKVYSLEKERDRLREALEHVVKLLDRPMLKIDMCLYMGSAIKVAREALKGAE